jgi:hypothetical protein
MKFKLVHDLARSRAIEEIRRAPSGFIVTIDEPTRSLEQNAKLHAIISDIAKSVEWNGNKFNVVVWKRLLTASYLREVGENPLLIPALDGSGLDIIYEKTSRMNVKQLAGLTEYCLAFGAENNVKFKERL